MKSPFKKLLVYDLETGGLDSKINPITEIAMVVVSLDTLEIVDEFSSLISPYSARETYEAEAAEVSHISYDLLEEQGEKSTIVAEKIVEFIKKHVEGNSKPILCGHNIKDFDTPFFEKFLEENELDLSKLVNKKFTLDTLEMARLKFTELANFSLGTCANEVELTLKEAHRALPDAKATAKFVIKIIQLLRGLGMDSKTYTRRKYDFNLYDPKKI